jgi:Protein of unknown function (DUF3833)
MNGITPGFRLERRLLGANRVAGLVHGRSGRLLLTFSGLMEGMIENGALLMSEELRYSDGRIDRRTWRIAAQGTHGYRGTTTDSVGTVTGSAQGNTVNLRYKLHLPIAGGLRKIAFDDWMYLQPDGIILDHAVMRMWGIRIGTVSATIAPVSLPRDRLSALFGG